MCRAKLCDRCSSNQELSIEQPDCANCAARVSRGCSGTRSRCSCQLRCIYLIIDAAKVGGPNAD